MPFARAFWMSAVSYAIRGSLRCPPMWLVVRYLHLLALAFFVGGQIMLAGVVVPVERGEENRARLRAIARRFGWGTLAALFVLIATGTALAGHYDRWDDSTLQI